MTTPLPVLIVGGGPSGVYLALALRLNGIDVRIIEKDTSFHQGTRGTGMQPRTLEMMVLLGVYDDILKCSRKLPPITHYTPGLPDQARILKTWNFVEEKEQTPSSPLPCGYTISQDAHEEIIRSHLKRFNVKVELGVELTAFEQDEGGVTATLRHHLKQGGLEIETIKVLYLVGTDGGKGVVRKKLGLSFLGETKEADAMIVADVECTGLSTKNMHLWELPKEQGSKRAFVRPISTTSDTSFNFVLMGNYTEEEVRQLETSPAAVQDAFHSISGRTDVIFQSIPFLGYFRPKMRMVNKFGERRIFVAGDAAHVHSPTGGQGLNSSVQDSINLAWKLSLVIKKVSPSWLLETYTEERLPVIAEMLGKTTGLYTKTLASDSDASTISSDENPSHRGRRDEAWTRGGALFMLGINYRWSSIVRDERDPEYADKLSKPALLELLKANAYGGYEAGLSAGDRAPDAPGLVVLRCSNNMQGEIKGGDSVSLFKLFNPAKHSILLFAPPSVEPSVIQRVVASVDPFVGAKYTTQIFHVSPSSPPPARVKGLDAVLIDVNRHARHGYLVLNNQVIIVVIRPDGYIGAFAKDVEGLTRYFEGIFLRSPVPSSRYNRNPYQ